MLCDERGGEAAVSAGAARRNGSRRALPDGNKRTQSVRLRLRRPGQADVQLKGTVKA